jgi:Ca-activated chloride channel family protein
MPVALLLAVGLMPAQDFLAQEDTPRFKAEVDQVVVYVAVYDDKGRMVAGLTPEDFTVLEDKVPQTLTGFARTEIPSTIGLVIDSSGSMRDKMHRVERAVDLFLQQNNPQNELFFVRFDDEVELEEDFTREPEDIRDALSNVVVRGGTALWDAIYLAVDKAQEGSEPRKVVVVFTDGEDKDSYFKHEELLAKVREADTQVFVVAFLDEELSDRKGFFGIFKSQRQKVQDQIAAVAEVTGGQAFFPEKVEDLAQAFATIAKDLKNQYRLAYISSNKTRDGQWRNIDVQVAKAKELGLKVRAKKGYYAPR